MHWLARREQRLPAARVEASAWAGALGEELAAERPDGVLLHYASFAYSHRGVPLLLNATLAATRRSQAPLVAMMHELVYPRRPVRELRENVWALTQRAALIALLRASSAGVVTMDYRANWLATRRWLPQRPLAVAPVFSNLPAPDPGVRAEPGLLGLFGYSYAGVAVELVLDALVLLEARRPDDVRLRLLGYPGRESEPGERWVNEAERRGVAHLLSFSGVLDEQELSDSLARCEVLLCAAAPGPTSSKGTLAASLASGRPLVAIDGPRTWSELAARDAARIVAPDASALAGELEALLADPDLRAALGARGRALHEQRMAVGRSAELVAGLFRDLT